MGYSAVGEGTPALIHGHDAFGDCFAVATLKSVKCLDVNTGDLLCVLKVKNGDNIGKI